MGCVGPTVVVESSLLLDHLCMGLTLRVTGHGHSVRAAHEGSPH